MSLNSRISTVDSWSGQPVAGYQEQNADAAKKALRRTAFLVPIVASLVMAACGGSAGTGSGPRTSSNHAPNASVLEPSGPEIVSRGGSLGVRFQASDRDRLDQVALNFYLDLDADLATKADRVLVAGPFADQRGAIQEALLDLSGFAEGSYLLYLEANDGRSRPVTALAGGAIEIANLSWAQSAGGKKKDRATALALAPDGSTYVAGYFSGQAAFGAPGIDEIVLDSGDKDDVFLANYRADGSLAWVAQAGGEGKDRALTLEALADGGAIVSGYYEKTATFGAFELPKSDKSDLFLARYDAYGNVMWAIAAGGEKKDEGVALAEMPDGRILLAGSYEKTAAFGDVELPYADEKDIFLACFDADGELDWLTSASGTKKEQAVALTVLPDGLIFLAGQFEQELTFGAGEVMETTLWSADKEDVFLACFQPDGSLDWATSAQGEGDQEATDLTALANGDVVMVGNLKDSAIFGAGQPNELMLASSGKSDAFYVCYSRDGGLVWASRTGDIEDDQARAVIAKADGSLAVAGTFRGAVAFGAGSANETLLTEDGANDGYLMSM
ncbi:MAG TPA: hypothetical protein VGC54_11330, partial [Planctomycetota bacterium]